MHCPPPFEHLGPWIVTHRKPHEPTSVPGAAPLITSSATMSGRSNHLLGYAMTQTYFTDRLRCRWDQLRGAPPPGTTPPGGGRTIGVPGSFSDAALGGRIDGLQATVGAAAGRNFDRWRILGRYVWPNPVVERTYAAEMARLRRY